MIAYDSGLGLYEIKFYKLYGVKEKVDTEGNSVEVVGRMEKESRNGIGNQDATKWVRCQYNLADVMTVGRE